MISYVYGRIQNARSANVRRSGANPSKKLTAKTDTAVKRWSAVGPYYAMMPSSFAKKQIESFTVEGDIILDPFAGRGTVPFAAAALGRLFFGIEIFPVGWVYSATKCRPASEARVLKRLEKIGAIEPSFVENSNFFKSAYCAKTLKFLCAARENLDWQRNQADRTLMALILITLHDKLGAGLSNQMRQTKAVHPAYAIRWWDQHDMLTPPDINPVEILREKIRWRYKKGIPKLSKGNIYLGDCTRVLARKSKIENVKMLFTSPPYFGVTNYYSDQWLRNWMLGGPPGPHSGKHAYKKRFNGKEAYRLLLEKTFTLAAAKLRSDAVILVRTDAREFSLDTTREVLRKVFPQKHMSVKMRPLVGRLSQTALFGDAKQKPGEVDILLR